MKERLWPAEENRPSFTQTFEDQEFVFTWDNTWIRTYRTGSEEYDQELRKYDHVLHLAEIDGDDRTYRIFSIDKDDPGFLECLEFMLNNGYPHRVDPIPDPYIIEHQALTESQTIPEAIGPEFGAPQT